MGDGRQVVETRMAPARIVPALDEVEERQAGLARGGKPVTIKQLTLLPLGQE